MPTYQYRCAKCAEQFELYQTFDDAPLKRHAQCGGKLDKVMGSVGIVLKGSGFYRNDHRSPARGNGDKRETEKAPANGDKAKETTPAAEKSSGGSGDANGSSGSSGSKESGGAGDSKRTDPPSPSKKAPTKT